VTERPISLRLDRESGRALRRLMRMRGLSRSAAIKAALVESAARGRRSLADEAAVLAADADDRAEIAQVRELMDELRAEG
jgi:hypothetical protein